MGNWWCTECKAWKDSWAEYQSHKPTETYRRDIRCWSCDNRNLIYTDSQKSRYKELAKERVSISGCVEEVERFSTWWSNNIATAIYYYEGCHRVVLLVYDPVYSTYKPAVFPDYCNSTRNWGNGGVRGFHTYFSDAQREAKWLIDELTNSYGKGYDNPILLIHDYCNSYKKFSDYIGFPFVLREEVGNVESTHLGVIVFSSGSLPSDLDSYFKPLDIIKVKEIHKFWGVRYYHFGIYLGNGEVCHFTRRINGVRKTDLKGFLEDQVGELYKYHPIVPFKHCDNISRQIAICIDKKFREDCYELHNRNCEHFANMIGFGINYSEQVEDNKNKIMFKEGAKAVLFGLPLLLEGPPTINNDKGSTIWLKNEINESNSELGYSSSDHWQAKEIKERYLQEVPPKQECRIM